METPHSSHVEELRIQINRYAPGSRMAPHVDGCRRLSILVCGGIVEGCSASGANPETPALRAPVGSVAIKEPATVHWNRFDERGTTILSVILPDAAMERLGLGACAVAPWRWQRVGDPVLHALRLATSVLDERPARALRCLRALLLGFRRDAVAGPPPPADLLRLRRRLRTRHSVRVDELAREHGVHPVSLGRTFRRHFGCSLTEYRQRVRIERVARALLASSHSLVDVALAHGFYDLSHMTRVFRREIGASPGEFRHALGHLGRLESSKTERAVSF